MSKILLFQDQDQIDNFVSAMTQTRDQVNAIIDEFNTLPLERLKTAQQLTRLLSGEVDGLIVDCLPDKGDTKLFGVTIKPAKVIELMELDTSRIKEMILNLNLNYVDQLLKISKVGRSVEILPNLLEAEIEKLKTYATTPREIEVAEAYIALKEATAKFVSLGVPYRPADWFKVYNGEFYLKQSIFRSIV